MEKDADGNYYYAEGTVNEQFDNVKVVEDSDGNLSVVVNGNEMRVHEFAHAFAGQRGAPSTDELAQGEKMLYVADGSAANSAAGDVVVARNNSGTIEEAVISLTYAGV